MSGLAKMKALHRRLDRIPKNKILAYALLPHLDEIVRMNIRQMEAFGIDSHGEPLKPYTRRTVRIKIEKGQESDFTTLRDTGRFHRSIRAKLFSNKVKITASDPNHLQEKYGDILGLAPFNQEFLKKIISPRIKSATLNYLKGNG